MSQMAIRKKVNSELFFLIVSVCTLSLTCIESAVSVAIIFYQNDREITNLAENMDRLVSYQEFTSRVKLGGFNVSNSFFVF